MSTQNSINEHNAVIKHGELSDLHKEALKHAKEDETRMNIDFKPRHKKVNK